MILGIYGTGGAARELYDMIDMNLCIRSQWEEIVFIDDTKGDGKFKNCRMMTFEKMSSVIGSNYIRMVIAVGEPALRELLYEKVKMKGYEFATIIHPSALVSKSAYIGKGVVIQENVTVSTDVHIEDNVFINGKAILSHDVYICRNCQICSLAMMAGGVRIGKACFVGASSAIRERIKIGNKAIIGMGAVVVRNVNDNMIVMGNPARECKINKGKVFK